MDFCFLTLHSPTLASQEAMASNFAIVTTMQETKILAYDSTIVHMTYLTLHVPSTETCLKMKMIEFECESRDQDILLLLGWSGGQIGQWCGAIQAEASLWECCGWYQLLDAHPAAQWEWWDCAKNVHQEALSSWFYVLSTIVGRTLPNMVELLFTTKKSLRQTVVMYVAIRTLIILALAVHALSTEVFLLLVDSITTL